MIEKAGLSTPDTHGANVGLRRLLDMADYRAIDAGDSLDLPGVYAYFNVLDQIFVSTKKLLLDLYIKRINELRRKFLKMYLSFSGLNLPTNRNAFILYSQCKELNSLLQDGLIEAGHLFSVPKDKEERGMSEYESFESILENGDKRRTPERV